MGNCASLYICGQAAPLGEEAGTAPTCPANWKLKQTKQKALAMYQSEGSLVSSKLLVLRCNLDDQDFFKKICCFAKDIDQLEVMLLWAELVKFKSISKLDIETMLKSAYDIYIKYIEHDGFRLVCKAPRLEQNVEMIMGWGNNEVKPKLVMIQQLIIKASTTESTGADLHNIHNTLLRTCLEIINSEIYIPFIATPGYEQYCTRIRESNKVFPDDFEYYDLLGAGNFGIVCHCRKKSTGKHYAMKIQSKAALLDNFSDAPEKIMYERDAAVLCEHPFIVSMHYTLQTESLVMMAVCLETGGTLHDALKKCPNFRMPEDRVVFYTAEIVLALSHIHHMGLIYRDLKPENVLLCSDGHIKLTDLGCVTDVKGEYLGRSDSSAQQSGSSGIFSSSFYDVVPQVAAVGSASMPSSAAGSLRYSIHKSPNGSGLTGSNNNQQDNPSGFQFEVPLQRAYSITGTGGYMAPEMLLLLKANRTGGYSAAVDYWSLGITVYRLLTGKLAFTDKQVSTFLVPAKQHYNIAYKQNFNEKPAAYVAFITRLNGMTNSFSANAIDFIRRLLEIDEIHRLGGSSPSDVREVKLHPFYSSIKWSALLRKTVAPPCAVENVIHPGLSSEGLAVETDSLFMSALRLLPKQYTNASEVTLVPHASFKDMLCGLDKDTHSVEAKLDDAACTEGEKNRLAHMKLLFNHPVFTANKYAIRPEHLKYFDSWDHVDSKILRHEIALSIEMDLGEKSSRRGSVSTIKKIVNIMRGGNTYGAGTVFPETQSASSSLSASHIVDFSLLNASTMALDRDKQKTFVEGMSIPQPNSKGSWRS